MIVIIHECIVPIVDQVSYIDISLLIVGWVSNVHVNMLLYSIVQMTLRIYNNYYGYGKHLPYIVYI